MLENLIKLSRLDKEFIYSNIDFITNGKFAEVDLDSLFDSLSDIYPVGGDEPAEATPAPAPARPVVPVQPPKPTPIQPAPQPKNDPPAAAPIENKSIDLKNYYPNLIHIIEQNYPVISAGDIEKPTKDAMAEYINFVKNMSGLADFQEDLRADYEMEFPDIIESAFDDLNSSLLENGVDLTKQIEFKLQQIKRNEKFLIGFIEELMSLSGQGDAPSRRVDLKNTAQEKVIQEIGGQQYAIEFGIFKVPLNSKGNPIIPKMQLLNLINLFENCNLTQDPSGDKTQEQLHSMASTDIKTLMTQFNALRYEKFMNVDFEKSQQINFRNVHLLRDYRTRTNNPKATIEEAVANSTEEDMDRLLGKYPKYADNIKKIQFFNEIGNDLLGYQMRYTLASEGLTSEIYQYLNQISDAFYGPNFENVTEIKNQNGGVLIEVFELINPDINVRITREVYDKIDELYGYLETPEAVKRGLSLDKVVDIAKNHYSTAGNKLAYLLHIQKKNELYGLQKEASLVEGNQSSSSTFCTHCGRFRRGFRGQFPDTSYPVKYDQNLKKYYHDIENFPDEPINVSLIQDKTLSDKAKSMFSRECTPDHRNCNLVASLVYDRTREAEPPSKRLGFNVPVSFGGSPIVPDTDTKDEFLMHPTYVKNLDRLWEKIVNSVTPEEAELLKSQIVEYIKSMAEMKPEIWSDKKPGTIADTTLQRFKELSGLIYSKLEPIIERSRPDVDSLAQVIHNHVSVMNSGTSLQDADMQNTDLSVIRQEILSLFTLRELEGLMFDLPNTSLMSQIWGETDNYVKSTTDPELKLRSNWKNYENAFMEHVPLLYMGQDLDPQINFVEFFNRHQVNSKLFEINDYMLKLFNESLKNRFFSTAEYERIARERGINIDGLKDSPNPEEREKYWDTLAKLFRDDIYETCKAVVPNIPTPPAASAPLEVKENWYKERNDVIDKGQTLEKVLLGFGLNEDHFRNLLQFLVEEEVARLRRSSKIQDDPLSSTIKITDYDFKTNEAKGNEKINHDFYAMFKENMSRIPVGTPNREETAISEMLGQLKTTRPYLADPMIVKSALQDDIANIITNPNTGIDNEKQKQLVTNFRQYVPDQELFMKQKNKRYAIVLGYMAEQTGCDLKWLINLYNTNFQSLKEVVDTNLVNLQSIPDSAEPTTYIPQSDKRQKTNELLEKGYSDVFSPLVDDQQKMTKTPETAALLVYKYKKLGKNTILSRRLRQIIAASSLFYCQSTENIDKVTYNHMANLLMNALHGGIVERNLSGTAFGSTPYKPGFGHMMYQGLPDHAQMNGMPFNRFFDLSQGMSHATNFDEKERRTRKKDKSIPPTIPTASKINWYKLGQKVSQEKPKTLHSVLIYSPYDLLICLSNISAQYNKNESRKMMVPMIYVEPFESFGSVEKVIAYANQNHVIAKVLTSHEYELLKDGGLL